MDNLDLRSKSQCESHHQELTGSSKELFTGSSKELLTGSPEKQLTDNFQPLATQDLGPTNICKKKGNQIDGYKFYNLFYHCILYLVKSFSIVCFIILYLFMIIDGFNLYFYY